MKETSILIKASIFLALCVMASMIQIPILTSMGLAIDFSLCILFISRRIVGNLYTLIIAIVYPWFSLITGAGGIVGATFLFIVSISFMFFDYLLLNVKGKYLYINSTIVILILSVIYYLLNVFIFLPIWNGMNWSILSNNTLNYFVSNLIIFIPFNILKLTLNIYLGIFIYKLINKNEIN